MTRHNLGWIVVEAFAKKQTWSFKQDRHFDARIAKGVIADKAIHLVLPTTYMNLSGIALKRMLDFYKLDAHSLIVVTDDIALPFGEIKLNMMGGSGGHKGLKSVEEQIGGTHYARLRMGIGHPGEKVMADYVLERFSHEEMKQLEPFVDKGVGVLERLITESISRVMNSVNERKISKNSPDGDRENRTNDSKQTKSI